MSAAAEVVDVALLERIEKAKTDYYEWDKLRDEGHALEYSTRPFGPSRDGSVGCESGSLASGGKNRYCTCDRCF